MKKTSSALINKKEININSDEKFGRLAEFFKVFGDVTRLKIIFLLSKSEMCVNDISKQLDMQQSTISHQLRILKQARLVKQRRDGKSIFYSLDDHHVDSIFKQGFDHIDHIND